MKDAAGKKRRGALGNRPGPAALRPPGPRQPPGPSKNFALAIGYKAPDSCRLELALASGLAGSGAGAAEVGAPGPAFAGRAAGKRSYFLVRRGDVRCP